MAFDYIYRDENGQQASFESELRALDHFVRRLESPLGPCFATIQHDPTSLRLEVYGYRGNKFCTVQDVSDGRLWIHRLDDA